MADLDLGTPSFADGPADASIPPIGSESAVANVPSSLLITRDLPRRFHAKRGVDLVLATIGLVMAAPIMLVVAIVIKVDDWSAPVLFRQTRIGLCGTPFRMLKFRTMDVDAERRIAALVEHNQASGPLFKLENDPRVTAVGRWLRRYSLDELPQLFNVLSGSMSLVGPRPPLPHEVECYEGHEHRRLLVLPGLTGLWQVSGRSLLSWEESIRLDLSYVENCSLALDIRILARTVIAVLNKKGAY